MLKKTKLIGLFCIMISVSAFASQPKLATLQFVNQTRVSEGFLSRAFVTLFGKRYIVCSKGTNCPSTGTVAVPANQPIAIRVAWNFGNGSHILGTSCQYQVVTLRPGEVKTYTMRGYPSDDIDYNSMIECIVS